MLSQCMWKLHATESLQYMGVATLSSGDETTDWSARHSYTRPQIGVPGTHTWPMPSLSRRSERRWHENILRKVLIQRNCEYRQCTTQELSFQWHRRSARAEICLGCWRDRPFLKRRGYSGGKAVGNTTGLRRRLHPHWRISLLQSLCRALGQTEASSNFQGLGTTRPRFEPHEQRPTRHEASALTTRPHVRLSGPHARHSVIL